MPSPRSRHLFAALSLAGLLIVAAGCSSASTPSGASVDVGPTSDRLDQIQAAVTSWGDATSLPQAQVAAEQTRNLVLGPYVKGYGDTNRDGTISGSTPIGLLPDESGGPGLALALAKCAGPDLLGGSWDNPGQRWQVMRTAIADWTPGNNTFPSLPSHPQRVVGWATLTLDTDNLTAAHEYAGHAQLHVDASRKAVGDCT